MLEHYTLTHPALPTSFDGLTILHVSDFHVRWPVERHRWWPALHEALRAHEVDLVALTGDYHDKPGHEPHGLELLQRMAGVWRSRFGAIGIHGNHDTLAFRALAREVDAVRWIGGRIVQLPVGDRGVLCVGGMDWPEDVVGMFAAHAGLAHESDAHDQNLTRPHLVLAHVPTALIPLAEFNVPLVLCGHTHAGQIRLSPQFAPHTSSDTPPHLAGGLLRYRGTLCAVSRAVGDGVIEGLRINCPRQVCHFTLRRGDFIDGPWSGGEPRQVIPW